MTRPLAGLKVLDLSRVLAGPWCTQLLADMGADVLKIERPGVGDDTRHWGPPWHEVGDVKVAAYFLSANRGKRSAAIDFARPEGADLVRRLALDADVMVENFKVGGLAKFGLDSASLRASNPRLITASITGFGQDGPYAHRAGYDYILQGMSGLMSITGQPDDEPGGGPMRIGVAVVDLFTGLYTANAILAALHARDRTGVGAEIDSALFDTALAVLGNQASYYRVGFANHGPRRVRHFGNQAARFFPFVPDGLVNGIGAQGRRAAEATCVGSASQRRIPVHDGRGRPKDDFGSTADVAVVSGNWSGDDFARRKMVKW